MRSNLPVCTMNRDTKDHISSSLPSCMRLGGLGHPSCVRASLASAVRKFGCARRLVIEAATFCLSAPVVSRLSARGRRCLPPRKVTSPPRKRRTAAARWSDGSALPRRLPGRVQPPPLSAAPGFIIACRYFRGPPGARRQPRPLVLFREHSGCCSRQCPRCIQQHHVAMPCCAVSDLLNTSNRRHCCDPNPA